MQRINVDLEVHNINFPTRVINWKTLPSKHTTSSQRREDVLLRRREDVLFAPTLGWKDVFWRRLEKTSSRRLVDVKAWRRIIVVFWLILCWKDVFATLYVRCL